jgi:kynureninase
MTTIHDAVAALGPGPLTEDGLREHIAPLFSRALAGDKARDEIYLANHSLGRPLDRTADDIAGALDLWYSGMDGAWGPGSTR